MFTELLAPRCEQLTTIDASATAVAAARARLAGAPHVRTILGAIPDALGDERFDLVVASEILYYLTAPELALTVAATGVVHHAGGASGRRPLAARRARAAAERRASARDPG